jgi:hypothetical protein
MKPAPLGKLARQGEGAFCGACMNARGMSAAGEISDFFM